MTSKERLLGLIEGMKDDQAARALRLVESITKDETMARRTVVPGSLGFGASGHTDLSERTDEIIGEGFGR